MIILGVIILAYILGSIPFGLIVGKLGYGIDIREHGSGNLGGTNSFRVLGVKAGLFVTIGDILKGTLAASLPLLFDVDIHALLIGVFAVVGHMYPIFAKFKGGKAVATSGGILLFYNPILFITAVLAFLLLLKITKIVSLSSILTSIYALIFSLFTSDLPLIIIVTVLMIFVVYRHRTNIKRIINKTEPKVKWL